MFLVRARRRELLAGAAVVARELRSNAQVAEEVEQHRGGVQTMERDIRTEVWEAQREKLHAFTISRDPDLWVTVAEAYERLSASKAQGIKPPRSADLRKLADRLEGAVF